MMKTLGLVMLVLGILGAGLLAGTESPSTATAPKPSTQPAKELILELGNKMTLKLVQIPAGKFLMGSPETEKRRRKDEFQHEVTISKPFYMGITHVTVDQFAAFVKDTGYKTDAENEDWSGGFAIKDGQFEYMYNEEGCSWRNPSFEQKGDHPVVHVSWNDAQAFCDWLSWKNGKTVVLPTEAQWEYACRAGTKTAYPWGDNPDDGKGWANCADQSLKKEIPNQKNWEFFFSWDDGYAFTAPVGSFKANAFGLYDMTGNACQLCQDRYGDYEKGAVTDPTGPAPKTRSDCITVRGGSWYGDLQRWRSACRDLLLPSERGGGGFRVAVAAGGEPSIDPQRERIVELMWQADAVKDAPDPKPALALLDQLLELRPDYTLAIVLRDKIRARAIVAKELTLDRRNKVTLKLVRIPAGKFLMGSPDTEKKRGKNETQHEVTISKAFYMGTTEVTQEQYKAVMGQNPSKFEGPTRPVEMVSWDDAVEFCKKLSSATGASVRLPTEAQWEYACRAGTSTRFSYGDDNDYYANLNDYAWHGLNSNKKTHRVGLKNPNAFGLYDMHGNVDEWCSDFFGDYSKDAAKDPAGPATGRTRVLRGGDRLGGQSVCRSACRGGNLPGLREGYIGFRVVVLAAGAD